MVARMHSGQLNQPVSLSQVQRVSDGGGGWEETWVFLADVWAKVEAATGDEKLAAGQVQSNLEYHVTIRWREGLDGTLSVVWRGKRLNVLFVADEGPQAVFVRLDCSTEGRT
jgi:SPP1 family predicted phage head-tail adaptor